MKSDTARRRFLFYTTAAFGAGGLAFACWPLIDQMGPDAGARAQRDDIYVDLRDLRPGQIRTVGWNGAPVFVAFRTEPMLHDMQEPQIVDRLLDPRSEARQQPSYARNWHRSIDPKYAVLVGVCTHCRCKLRYLEDRIAPSDLIGGYFCECCASRYDPAGRVYGGIARLNLLVPPHAFISPTTLSVGGHPPGTNPELTLRSDARV